MMTLLCLLAALSAAPLRHAEAASDLARSLDRLGMGHVIEVIDGGVGDDAGETVLKTGCDTPLDLAMAPPAIDWIAPPLLPALSLPGCDDHHRADRVASLPAGSVRRHAWLQCFLC
jgi:hypothetical protein